MNFQFTITIQDHPAKPWIIFNTVFNWNSDCYKCQRDNFVRTLPNRHQDYVYANITGSYQSEIIGNLSTHRGCDILDHHNKRVRREERRARQLENIAPLPVNLDPSHIPGYDEVFLVEPAVPEVVVVLPRESTLEPREIIFVCQEAGEASPPALSSPPETADLEDDCPELEPAYPVGTFNLSLADFQL